MIGNRQAMSGNRHAERKSALDPPGAFGMVLLLAILSLACVGCLSVNPVDENSLEHALQQERNVATLNNGMDDAAIDKAIADAWAVADPEPDAGSSEHEAWTARRAQSFERFREMLRGWAKTDIERDVWIDQAAAWVAYERSKQE